MLLSLSLLFQEPVTKQSLIRPFSPSSSQLPKQIHIILVFTSSGKVKMHLELANRHTYVVVTFIYVINTHSKKLIGYRYKYVTNLTIDSTL